MPVWGNTQGHSHTHTHTHTLTHMHIHTHTHMRTLTHVACGLYNAIVVWHLFHGFKRETKEACFQLVSKSNLDQYAENIMNDIRKCVHVSVIIACTLEAQIHSKRSRQTIKWQIMGYMLKTTLTRAYSLLCLPL